MDIAIIGTGNVGKALGTSLTGAGHAVTFAGRDEQKAELVAAEFGVSSARTSREAAQGADVVILAVPFSELENVARDIAPVVTGKVVIDTTNPLTPDYSGLATQGGASAAERLARVLDGARVVKAFNTLFAGVQADPRTHGIPVDALISTDDPEARTKTSELASSIGLRAVDAGPLVRARELEALAFLNIQLQMRHGGDWRTAVALVGAPAAATTEPAAATLASSLVRENNPS